jgi:hypothetical protein
MKASTLTCHSVLLSPDSQVKRKRRVLMLTEELKPQNGEKHLRRRKYDETSIWLLLSI